VGYGRAGSAYIRRRPENTVLHQVVRVHLETFLAEARLRGYDAQTYAAWQTPDQRSAMHVEAQTIDDVRKSGVYRVVTPDECVALANEMGRIILHPLMGGMPPELGWQGLRLFESKVLPLIR